MSQIEGFESDLSCHRMTKQCTFKTIYRSAIKWTVDNFHLLCDPKVYIQGFANKHNRSPTAIRSLEILGHLFASTFAYKTVDKSTCS